MLYEKHFQSPEKPPQTTADRKEEKPRTATQSKRQKGLDSEEEDDEQVNALRRHGTNPIDFDNKSLENYSQLTADQVFTFAKKEIKKVQRLLQIQTEENYKSQHETGARLADMRKAVGELQASAAQSNDQLRSDLMKRLQEEIALVNEELDKKAETEHVDRLFALADAHEERLKAVESLKLMAEMSQATQDEKLNTLRFKMEAFEHKMGIVIQRLSQLLSGQLDKALTQPTEELAQ